MSQPKAALLEIYDSHEVNIYSQLRFLQEGGYDVTLIVSERHRNTVRTFGGGFSVEYVSVTSKGGLAQWQELWRIRQMIISRGITTVIFNTAHTNPVRNFCLLPFPGNIKFFGTLHGVNKLEGSLTQKIISRRIPNYYLLADYMLEKAMKMPHKGLLFSVFYPIFQPHFAAANIEPKGSDEYWIAIPGSVEYKRRDYLSLLNAFAALATKPAVRFLLLGNGDHPHGNGPELRQKIADLGLQKHFLFFNGYVDDAVLHSYLQHCDAVMPLIHPINADMEKYLENQISGSFHRAFTYRKPLLMHEYFSRYQDFRETALFYSLEGLQSFLDGLEGALSSFNNEERYANSKWTLNYQAKNYCAFLSDK
jgi:glycosyltransferase involved in cell wall biosynthesis